jgi:hypothetical protein
VEEKGKIEEKEEVEINNNDGSDDDDDDGNNDGSSLLPARVAVNMVRFTKDIPSRKIHVGDEHFRTSFLIRTQ